jgi:hypothetical protein
MSVTVAVEKGTKAVISVSTAYEHSITYERISLLKFPKKTFSTATPVIVKHANRRLLRGL